VIQRKKGDSEDEDSESCDSWGRFEIPIIKIMAIWKTATLKRAIQQKKERAAQ
jgi:hypothetical protein